MQLVTGHTQRENIVRAPAFEASQFTEGEIQYYKGKSRAGEKSVNLLCRRLKVDELNFEKIACGKIETSGVLL